MKLLHMLVCIGLLSSCTSQEEGKIPIAILTPASHPSLEQIEKGFKETIEAQAPGKYRFDTYNAQGNKTLMRAEVEKIAHTSYALVFTLGASASQMTSEVFAKKELHTPLVFTAVSDPHAFPFGEAVTGVEESIDFEQELEQVLRYKPTLHTVLLVFNPLEAGILKDQEQIRAILHKQGLELKSVEVFSSNELMAKVSPLMKQADALLVLKDNTTVGGLDTLVKLCNQYHIPLMASDLDSPDRGAAFGYGVYEVEFGIEGAKKSLQILNHEKSPQEIPITPISHFVFKINHEAAALQGIEE